MFHFRWPPIRCASKSSAGSGGAPVCPPPPDRAANGVTSACLLRGGAAWLVPVADPMGGAPAYRHAQRPQREVSRQTGRCLRWSPWWRTHRIEAARSPRFKSATMGYSPSAGRTGWFHAAQRRDCLRMLSSRCLCVPVGHACVLCRKRAAWIKPVFPVLRL